MNRTRIFLIAALLLSAFAGAFFTGQAAALGESVINQGFKIMLVSSEFSGNTSTWTYAVSTTSEVAQGMSHITFGVEASCGYTVLAPTTGLYTTPTNIPYCSTPGVSCQAANYQVEIGSDPTTGVSGVKFNTVSNTLEKGNLSTHIFQITVQKDGDHVTGLAPVGLKAGSGEETSLILGPVCGPTAVQLSGLSAVSSGISAMAWFVPAAPMAVTLLALKLRKKSARI